MKIKDNGKEIPIRDSITKIIPQGDSNPISISTNKDNENEKSINLSFNNSYLFDNILSDTLNIEKNNEKISINTKDSGSSGSTNINGIEVYELKYDDVDNLEKTAEYVNITNNNFINKGIITLLNIGLTYFYPTFISSFAITGIALVDYYDDNYENKLRIYGFKCRKDEKIMLRYAGTSFYEISEAYEDIF